jgi:dipeptidyl aminopeptidase/acylaminoacyl peptidase/formylglycine-generating enzyme required for sulfatase activity
MVHAALGAAPEAEQVQRPVQIEDLFSWKELLDLRLSPDGAWVAYALSEAQPDQEARTGDIWLVSTSAAGQDSPSAARRVTRDPADDSSPRWSHDSRRLAFLSTRGSDEELAQIYVYELAGGEPQRLTEHETGVTALRWSPDGRTIYYLAPDDTEHEDNDEKDDSERVEQDHKYGHIWAVDVNTQETRRITGGKFHITEFSVSPDGRQLALVAAPTPLLNYEEQVEVYTIRVSGGPRRRLTQNRGIERHVRWSPDGRWISFAAQALADGSFHYVAPDRLFAVSAGGGEVCPLMGEISVGLGGEHFWSGDSRSVFLPLDRRVTHQLAELELREEQGRLKPGQCHLRYEGQRFLTRADPNRDGSKIAFALEDPSHSRDIYVAGTAQLDNSRRLTTLNPQHEALRMARCEVIRWKSLDGQEVEGLLYYPLDYQVGERAPLLVNIHGGPLAAEKIYFMMDMYTYPHLAAARGYASLFVNYRGSSGYGDTFARAILGAYYTLDVQDILAGVDHLIQQGIADPNRLGVHGWSNGGILTTWITTETGRFKAAAVGAADVNWISDYGTADISIPFDREYFGGPPWQHLKLYLDKSPIFRMDRVTTPTLILHGAKDVRVPTSQGFEHFRALKEHAKTKVEMVTFPREEHTLLEIAHQRTKVERELAWFDQYILGLAGDGPRDDSAKPKAGREESKKKSSRTPQQQPLAGPLRAKVAQAGGLFGQQEHGILVPETVPLTTPYAAEKVDERGVRRSARRPVLAIGRFEVTCAQYQHFLADVPAVPIPQAKAPFDSATVWDLATRRFRPGYANHPVMGITGEEARRYCRWLSKKTGREYRLPTASHWQRAAKGKDSGEFPWGDEFESGRGNTACHWAKKTIFSAGRFFRGTEGQALLKERLPTTQAGSFEPSESHAYDLCGNVWELCTQGDKWVARGGAWSSTPAELRLASRLKLAADERRNDVGFRVLLFNSP